MPAGVAQKDGTATAGDVVRRGEEPAELRLEAEHLEEVAAHNEAPHRRGGTVHAKGKAGESGSGERGERLCAAVAQVAIVGIGHADAGEAWILNLHHGLRIGHRQAVEDEAVDDAGDDDVGGDGQRERGNGGEQEAGGAAELAKGKAQVVQQGQHRREISWRCWWNCM